MQNRFSPASTPFPLKIFLWLIAALSLVSTSLTHQFALSLDAWNHWHLWQFITYPLLHPLFSNLFFLIFNLYLLWVFGSSLIERMGFTTFMCLYFGSAACAGAFALGASLLFSFPLFLYGGAPPLYALLIAWILLNPDARLLLFFAMPFKARNLVLFLIGANALIDLSSGRFDLFAASVGATLFGYLFAIFICKTQSPFLFLARFERFLLRLYEKITHFKNKKEYRHSKIYDIKSGEPVLDDDQFMDAMLAKISLYGEHSLSLSERKRMEEISRTKASKRG